MKVHEALARGFAAEGTTTVFGMMGDANMYWMNAMDRIGVRLVEVRHEGAGLAMADGWARATGQPGVCTTTSGPGVTQLATQLLVASRGASPLVGFIGDAPVSGEALQTMDQARFAAACEAGFVQLRTPEDANDAVKRAFYLARTESRPVLLSAPSDVQNANYDDEPYAPSTELLPLDRAYPNPEAIERAAEIVASSRRPVIIVGRGAMLSGADAMVLKLADHIGALLATTLLAKNWLSDRDQFHAGISGLYATKIAMELFQESDVVIAVGAGLNKFTTEHGYLFPNAAFIQFDTRPSVVMGDGRAADVFIHSDAVTGVEVLDSALQRRGLRQQGYRTHDVRERLAAALRDDQGYELVQGTIDPREACRVIDDCMPPDFGLVIGGGHSSGFAIISMPRSRPFVLVTQDFGCIGQGLSTAIGAMTATGDRPTVVIEGDGGFMMHLAEFETAVRCGLPLLALVTNDQGLGAEFHKSIISGLNAELPKISTPDLGAVGRALGGRGSRATSVVELTRALDEFACDPAPTLVDVRISPSVISIPYRRRHYGQEA